MPIRDREGDHSRNLHQINAESHISTTPIGKKIYPVAGLCYTLPAKKNTEQLHFCHRSLRMRFSRVFLEAVGYELAPEVVPSLALEEKLAPLYKKLYLQPGLLEAWTGIRERRWWHPNTTNAHEAAKAAQKTLDKTGITPADIGAIVYTGVSRDFFEPATACVVAAHLGLGSKTLIFDLSNACLGVMNGIVEIANKIELGQIRAGLVVSSETAREIVDEIIRRMNQHGTMDYFKSAFTTLTLGSGAAAVLLSDGSFSPKVPRLVGGVSVSAAHHYNLCKWGLDKDPVTGLQRQFMETDALGMLKNSKEMRVIGNLFREELTWSKEMIDKIICHQVAAANQAALLEALEVSSDKDFSTLSHLGNMGTVSLPITAAIAEEKGFLHAGDRVAFFGIGSGLNSLMLGWEW